ncbi:GNAT family N-acetyltransferase [Oceanihabitans sp.]|nr:GNAT family N-acetyltransferase [Oceanihabitans sp.]
MQTQRLALHVINADDVDIIYDLRSNAEVQKYIQRDPFTKTEHAEAQIKKVLDLQNNQEAVTWIIKLKSDSKKVGSICFWNFSSDRKSAELGYDLLPSFHNKGIMSEVIKVILDFGFKTLHLSKVEAYTSKYNKSSIALLEKHKFEFQADKFDKGYPDNVIYSLSRR